MIILHLKELFEYKGVRASKKLEGECVRERELRNLEEKGRVMAVTQGEKKIRREKK